MGQPILSEAEFDGLVTSEGATAPVETATTLSPSQVSAALEAPVAELVAPVQAETEPEPDETESTTAAPRDEAGRFADQGKRKAGPQARINEAIRKQRDAEREAAHWREQAQRAASAPSVQSQPSVDPSDPEPVLDQFMDKADPYLELTKAAARWAARQETRTITQTQVEQGRLTKHFTEVQRLSSSLPNGKELLSLAQTMPPPHPELRNAMLESDASARLVFHFAEHPEDYDALQRASGPQLLRALGQLEGRLAAAQSGPAPQARLTTPVITPIKPVGSAPVSTTLAPDDLEFGPEYIRQMNARDRERKKLHF